MQKYTLVDSGYWFGLLDSNDSRHIEAQNIATLIENHKIIIPYPSMYEVLNSKFIKNKKRLATFENIMKNKNTLFLYDDDYRVEALSQTYEVHRKSIPQISLVDSVIREMVKDINIKIDFMVTFNEKDFRDVCDTRGVEIIST